MDYNDYELVSLAQEGNEDALNILYQKYKPLIVKKSSCAISGASHHGIEINDIIQECYIAFDEAIKNFLPDDDATFYTFANLCIDRQLINYLRKTTKGKNKLLNDAINIDDYVERVIGNEYDVEDSFINKSDEESLISNINSQLTDFEKEVFNLKIKGYNFEEIANTLNRNVKSIYNTFHRIKQKIKKIIEDDN